MIVPCTSHFDAFCRYKTWPQPCSKQLTTQRLSPGYRSRTGPESVTPIMPQSLKSRENTLLLYCYFVSGPLASSECRSTKHLKLPNAKLNQKLTSEAAQTSEFKVFIANWRSSHGQSASEDIEFQSEMQPLQRFSSNNKSKSR